VVGVYRRSDLIFALDMDEKIFSVGDEDDLSL
jgi:hypothetical protein